MNDTELYIGDIVEVVFDGVPTVGQMLTGLGRSGSASYTIETSEGNWHELNCNSTPVKLIAHATVARAVNDMPGFIYNEVTEALLTGTDRDRLLAAQMLINRYGASVRRTDKDGRFK